MMNKIVLSMIACTLSSVCSYGDGVRPQITLRSGGQVEFSEFFDLDQSILAARSALAKLAGDNKTCLEQFDLLSEELGRAYTQEGTMSAEDVQMVLEGVGFAAEKHKTQVRKNKEQTPYISHPIGVAVNVMKIGQVRDASVVIAALLHDTIEDTKTTLEEISGHFGKDVAQYVAEVTDNKALAREQRKRDQVIHAAKKSAGAAQIKLADKLYNLRDLTQNPPPDWSRERIDQYFQWAKSVVDRLPSANDRLKDAVDDLIDGYWEGQNK